MSQQTICFEFDYYDDTTKQTTFGGPQGLLEKRVAQSAVYAGEFARPAWHGCLMVWLGSHCVLIDNWCESGASALWSAVRFVTSRWGLTCPQSKII